MTAFVAVELEPGAGAVLAANALRQPALRVYALLLGRTDVLATVEVDDAAALAEALAAVRRCRGIRTSDAVEVEA